MIITTVNQSVIPFICLIIIFRGLPFSDSTIKWLLICLNYRGIKRSHSCDSPVKQPITVELWRIYNDFTIFFRLSGDRRFETPCESQWSFICKQLLSDFHDDIILKIIAIQLSHDNATGEFPNENYIRTFSILHYNVI